MSISIPRSAQQLTSTTTGAQLVLEVHNFDPYPQDVEFDLTVLNGSVVFTLTIPHLEKGIQQVMPPARGRLIKLGIKHAGNGYQGRETLQLDRLRYRRASASGWGSWQQTPAQNGKNIATVTVA
jgi:hypothetical protein